MIWEIKNNELLGPITFRTELSEVLASFGEPNMKFKRTPDTADTVYAYDNEGFYLNVNEKFDICEITVFLANSFVFDTIQLLGCPIDEVKSKLLQKRISICSEDAGLWCDNQNILLIDVEGIVDGVEIYRPLNT